MHHFLQHHALGNGTTENELFSQKDWPVLSEPDREKLDPVLDYYRQHLIDQDLRTSDYMASFKDWVSQQDNDNLIEVPVEFLEHIGHLKAFDPVYRLKFWESHHKKILSIFHQNLPLIQRNEVTAKEELSRLTRAYWQDDKIRVDICIFGKSYLESERDRPYTTVEPTHIVMHTYDQPEGNWLELLFHESSHHLIGSRSGFIGGTIIDVAVATQEKSPRSLWHAYLFYFSGVVIQKILQGEGHGDYELYMVRNNVFASYQPLLKKHLPAYIAGEKTLATVTETLIKDWNSKR